MRTFHHPLRAVACVLGLCMVAGCAPKPVSTVPEPQEDFDHGANRAPMPKTLYATARILAANGDEARSQVILMRIISEHRQFLPAYCDLAEMYMRRREVEKAIEILQTGLRVSPRDPILLNNVGMCWIVKGRYDRALSYFTDAASSAPMDARYRANMAVALGLQGRYEESLTLFSQVVPMSEAHYNLAVLCESRNDITRARKEYALARQCSPATQPASMPATASAPK